MAEDISLRDSPEAGGLEFVGSLPPCRRVLVPTPPPRLSSPPRQGEGLPRGCLDLSLDLRVGTAPGFRGGPKGGRPLLPLPRGQTPSRTFPITAPGLRSHAARTPASRAPRAQSPGPFPGTRNPARSRGSRWRLLALGSRPPDAARQQPPVAPSLPAAAAAETATARRGGRAPPPARLGVGAGPPRGAPEPCPRGRSPAGPRSPAPRAEPARDPSTRGTAELSAAQPPGGGAQHPGAPARGRAPPGRPAPALSKAVPAQEVPPSAGERLVFLQFHEELASLRQRNTQRQTENRAERVECRKRTPRSPSENVWRNPAEGVNFQAVQDLQSLASAAALKGQASASKWLSAQTRLPRRPRPLHPLFHHLLDVKSSPEPISADPT
ncbi:basic proline-rich protein-like [Cervus elaphus]|uniref:basic proline-rich protein-like n=1 Tax=Cervus elaphus TaxID=9860 RepID=UPI001CC2BFA3|nr:basic proline-rich protein-like [Cervus elaphus]